MTPRYISSYRRKGLFLPGLAPQFTAKIAHPNRLHKSCREARRAR